MKYYLIITGIMFVFVIAGHLVRIMVEGIHLLLEPAFIVSAIISIAMGVWALILLKRQHRN